MSRDMSGELLRTALRLAAKGGIVVSLARDLRLPVAYLGVGEGKNDLVPYNARDFARALLAAGED